MILALLLPLAAQDIIVGGPGSSSALHVDASDAGKFSRHVVVWLQDGAALSCVAEAGGLAAWVCAQLPDSLLMAASTDGVSCPVVDMHVYHKHQQMRLMGCVKLGDSRFLRLQHHTVCFFVCGGPSGVSWEGSWPGAGWAAGDGVCWGCRGCACTCSDAAVGGSTSQRAH